MRVALTYNIKKEVDDNVIHSHIESNHTGNYIDKNLQQNYTHRLSDLYAEWDEEETINAIKNALEKRGHIVSLIEADEDAYIKLKDTRPEIVFNIAEGFGGAARESYIPAICEMLDIPYTASDPVTVGICHDKSRCKEVLRAYNIPTPEFFITDVTLKADLKYPKFVKPLHEGSSKGIYNSSIVHDLNELNAEITRIKNNYIQPSIIEDFIDGREFTVAVLGNGKNAKVLPVIEINMDTLPANFPKIYSYEVKWFFDTRENKLDIFTCPANLSVKLNENIEKICLDAYKVLRIRDWARIDVRCDEDENPYIIEVNPLPGILPDPDDNSCFPKAAREVGLGYDELINKVLNFAIDRYNLNG